MTTKQNIQVFARCRPLRDKEAQTIINIPPSDDRVSISQNDGSAKDFFFDQVFPPATQQEVIYDTVVRPMTEKVLRGINCTILAYGDSGTGKTYTMVSGGKDYGIISRTVGHIFNKLNGRTHESTMHVSFFGLINHEAYDLLSPPTDIKKLKMIEISPLRGTIVFGNLKEHRIKSAYEISKLLELASVKRQTILKSSKLCIKRFHEVFDIKVFVKEKESQFIKMGKFSLIDLASIQHRGNRQTREADYINQSLHSLRKVISALAGEQCPVPYKESGLTRLLQDSLGGSACTSMIATISPANEHLAATIMTLKYASRARSINNKLETNQRYSGEKTLAAWHGEEQMYMDRYANNLRNLISKVINKESIKHKRDLDKLRRSYEEKYAQKSASLRIDFESMLKDARESRDKAQSDLKMTIEAMNQYRLQLEESNAVREKLEKNLEDRSEQLERQKPNVIQCSDNKNLGIPRSLKECFSETNLQTFQGKTEDLWKKSSEKSNLGPSVKQVTQIKTKVTKKLRYREDNSANRGSPLDSEENHPSPSKRRETAVEPPEKRVKLFDSQKNCQKKLEDELSESKVSSPASTPSRRQQGAKVRPDNYVPNRYQWTFAMHGSGKEDREWPPPRKLCCPVDAIKRVVEVGNVKRSQNGILVYVKAEGLEGEWPVEHHDYWKLSNATPPLKAFFDANPDIKSIYEKNSPEFLLEAYRIDQA